MLSSYVDGNDLISLIAALPMLMLLPINYFQTVRVCSIVTDDQLTSTRITTNRRVEYNVTDKAFLKMMIGRKFNHIVCKSMLCMKTFLVDLTHDVAYLQIIFNNMFDMNLNNLIETF